MVTNSGNASKTAFFDQQRLVMGASALLLRDQHGRIVLVKPRYKRVWHLPGGLIEPDESPRDAARRETQEEIGLETSAGRLLVVDYKDAEQ